MRLKHLQIVHRNKSHVETNSSFNRILTLPFVLPQSQHHKKAIDCSLNGKEEKGVYFPHLHTSYIVLQNFERDTGEFKQTTMSMVSRAFLEQQEDKWGIPEVNYTHDNEFIRL